MIDVSIVIPVFNAERSLGDCLDAISRQDLSASEYEVIIVDNNSTDGSMAIARKHPTAQVLAEACQGAYAARNRGVCAARGRWIAFTDPDCVPRPDWLRQLVAHMADPAVHVVMGRDRPAGSSTAVRLLGEYDHRKEIFVTGSSDAAIYYGHTNNMITRRATLDQAGLFHQVARGSDVIFVQNTIARHGTGAVRYEPAAVVDHLEIQSASTYFHKAFIYGGSGYRYSSMVASRPLRHAERMHIFRDTVAACGLSWMESAYLFAMLGIGVACFEAGWRSAAVTG